MENTLHKRLCAKGLKTNLLGLSAITALQLIQRMYATYNQEPDVVKQFSNF